jgi:hypothetical protein
MMGLVRGSDFETAIPFEGGNGIEFEVGIEKCSPVEL